MLKKGSKGPVKPVYDGHLWFQWKVARFTQAVKLRKPLDAVKTELCTIVSAYVQFRVQRQ